MMHRLTKTFSSIKAVDLPLVGGKGANLGELTHAGFPIPSGFCVTTIAFEQFVAACTESEEIYAQLDSVTDDLEEARRVGQYVRETLLAVPIPSFIEDAVRKAWQTAGVDAAYAVRSSATAEDLPDASFAGQQDTYLNVIGEEALFDAVRRCWVSLFTDRAILYRVENNFNHREVQLSVVVQQMVMSELSGILFTADPLTGHRHTASIDASFGLGEALVSGLVSPDAYRVDKRSMTIIDREIADKQIAIYPEKEGGVRQVKLTAVQRTQTVLSDQQIIKLAELGSRVEAHYGTPQDIEWAMADGELFLLQARPITSLYPIEGLQSADGSLHVYFSVGSQQMMTNVMSPLGMSGMATVLPLGKPDGELETAVLKPSGGHLFADLTHPMRHPIFSRVVPRVLSQFDALAPEMLNRVTQRPEFQKPHNIKLRLTGLRIGLGIISNVLANLFWRDLTNFPQKATEFINEGIKKRKKIIEEVDTPQGKVQATIDGIRSLPEIVISWIPVAIAGIAATQMIKRVGQGRVDSDALDSFDLALPGNVVTEMNLAIGDLADLARQSPQLVSMFENLEDDSKHFLMEARPLKDTLPFFEAWDRFLVQYGSRGSAEIDIKALRWYEEPLPVLQVIASFLQQETGRHRSQHNDLIAKREMAKETIIKTVQSVPFGWFRSRILRRMLHVSAHGIVLREHHKFTLVEMLRVAKEILKEIGTQYVAEGKLSHRDDLYYFRWPELLAFANGNLPNSGDLIAQRRADFNKHENLTPPAVLTSDGETPIVKYNVEDAPEGALIGNPVSPGVVEGIARVIRDPQAETLRPGEILVAPFTDPGWTPLFINAGGLIMEVGGAMTHGSVVAREYGIPAIVGVTDATTNIQSGQRIRVDGNRGIIENV